MVQFNLERVVLHLVQSGICFLCGLRSVVYGANPRGFTVDLDTVVNGSFSQPARRTVRKVVFSQIHHSKRCGWFTDGRLVGQVSPSEVQGQRTRMNLSSVVGTRPRFAALPAGAGYFVGDLSSPTFSVVAMIVFAFSVV